MGHKSRRKRDEKKQHTTAIVVDMGTPVSLRSLAVNARSELIFQTDAGVRVPAGAYLETSYPRTKGAKLLHRMAIPPQRLDLNPNRALCRFGWLIGVDTNTHRVGAHSVSTCGIVQARMEETAKGLSLGVTREMVVQFLDVTAPPERVGWVFVLKSIVDRAPETAIGLVVDSDVSRLGVINVRKEPILSSWYLPEGFEIVYATADSGADYAANALIRRCDRIASHVSTTHSFELTKFLPAAEGEPYTNIRIFHARLPAA